MANWIIDFKSLRGTLYRVTIGGKIGSDQNLTTAGRPFVTEEDKSEDWFEPVRTQSGYIRIVDDGTVDWALLLPSSSTSRPVTMTQNGTILWQGFMQPQTFSGNLYDRVQEREFPVMCGLEVLKGVTVDASIREVKTFAYLLLKISQATGLQWTSFNFSGDVEDWLWLKIDWQNFLGKDANDITIGQYNYYELLEEMCKFFGWTCRTYGTDMYFVAVDEHFSPEQTSYTVADLEDIDGGYTPHPQTSSLGTVELDDDVYASTDNTDEIPLGFHKAVVTAKINKQEVVEQFPYEDIEKEYVNNQVTRYNYGNDTYLFQLNVDDYTMDMYDTPAMRIRLLGGNANYGSYFYMGDFYHGNINHKHNYNWTSALVVRGSVPSAYATDQLVQVISKQPHNYDHGVFVISADVAQVLIQNLQEVSYPGNGTMTCRLRIGDLWWNGASWTSTRSSFTVNIGDEAGATTGTGKIIDNRQLDGPYNAYTGFGVPIDSALGGTVEFHIYGISLIDSHGVTPEVRLTNLEMKFVREKAYGAYSDKSENAYFSTNTSEYPDEKKVETIFASDNGNAFGLGIIMNSDGTYASGIEYAYAGGGTQEHPEQHLADRMALRGGSTKRMSRVEIWTNLVTITPSDYVDMAWGKGYPVSISHDWRDDVTRAVILEV